MKQRFAYQWPGAHFSSAFEGDDVSFLVQDSGRLKVTIDGVVVATVDPRGRQEYRISGLKPGIHHIRLDDLSEHQDRRAHFWGFRASLKAAAQPGAPLRKIEFIGDSITVGYGDTSGKRECSLEEVARTTDTSQAFATLVAAHYGADYQMNAISGRGIVRNYDGSPADTLPAAYPYALFNDRLDRYEGKNWHPQIIVIGLGANDFSTPLHDGEKWKTREELQADYEETYVTFIKTLRARNPEAFFILLAFDVFQDREVESEIGKVINRLQEEGEHRIAFLRMAGLNLGGCNSHPDTGDHQKMSNELIAFIDQHSEIWLGH
jgi:lysophospholipase L1-like esterase